MKHALFVAYHYPPEASSSGVLRTLKYTKYLAEFGWRVTVICPNIDAYNVVDHDLVAQIPEEVQILRTKYLNSKKHFSIRGYYTVLSAIPDQWIGWYPWAVGAGRRVMNTEKVDLVYSTSPYATAHLIASSLARKKNCPLVIDFRDPWYEVPPEPDTPRIRHWFARILEKRVIKQAKRVITSTRELRDSLAMRYSDQSSEKFIAVLNGYDEEDFTSLDDDSREEETQSDVLTIVHAGSINANFRDPRPFLSALRGCIEGHSLQPDQVMVRFIGPGKFAESRELQLFLDSNNLRNYVEFVPRLPYKEALKSLHNADLLLLLQASEDTRSLVPAKLYEYLRIQKPVLALVLTGAVSEILDETGGAWAVNPQDKEKVSEAIETIIHLWKQKQLSLHHVSLSALEKFDRRALTEQLSGLFDSLVK